MKRVPRKFLFIALLNIYVLNSLGYSPSLYAADGAPLGAASHISYPLSLGKSSGVTLNDISTLAPNGGFVTQSTLERANRLGTGFSSFKKFAFFLEMCKIKYNFYMESSA